MTHSFEQKLPPSVAEIADVIGREQALHLIGALPRSGTRAWRVCVYIPKTLPSLDHPLVRILGYRDAKRMIRAFSGMILQPSNCKNIARGARNRRIFEMSTQGMSVREIAEGVDLSPYRVREILAGNPPEARGRAIGKTAKEPEHQEGRI